MCWFRLFHYELTSTIVSKNGGLLIADEEDVAAVIGLEEPAKVVVVDVDKEAVDTTDGTSGDGGLVFVDCSLS